jgi:DNA-binding protein H-NS
MITLEEEFEKAKAKHKLRVLENKLTKYFEVIEHDEINLSGIYYKSPKQRAKEEAKKLAVYDINKFNSLYEKAYAEMEA